MKSPRYSVCIHEFRIHESVRCVQRSHCTHTTNVCLLNNISEVYHVHVHGIEVLCRRAWSGRVNGASEMAIRSCEWLLQNNSKFQGMCICVWGNKKGAYGKTFCAFEPHFRLLDRSIRIAKGFQSANIVIILNVSSPSPVACAAAAWKRFCLFAICHKLNLSSAECSGMTIELSYVVCMGRV